MKTSNKSSLITGVALLVVAALFSISLILQPLDFGVSSPGHNNIFYLLGNMLYSVYGFSSILIPAFLLIAGLSCFAAKWTARKTMRLLTALVPFFTCVVTENICRSILALGKGSFSGVKIGIAVITGIMLIVIEWLGIGIIADKLNNKSSDRPRLRKISVPETNNEKSSVFDQVLAEVSPSKTEEVEQSASEESTATAEADEADDAAAPTTPLLTQEEYAALTTPEEDLGWNLPPAPETLPPEYDEDFDEDDPALQFPPKDDVEETAEVEETEQSADDSTDVTEEEAAEKVHLEPVDSVEAFTEDEEPAFDVEFEDNDDYYSDNSEEKKTFEDQDEFSAQVIEEESPFFDEDLESSPIEDEVEESESPYSSTRYIDSVVENPKFPHGIVIHEEGEEIEEEEEEVVEPEKPKFPSKIQIQSTPQVDEDFEDDYIEDETLPFPEFDVEEPAINSWEEEQEERIAQVAAAQAAASAAKAAAEARATQATPASSYQPMPSAIPETPVRQAASVGAGAASAGAASAAAKPAGAAAAGGVAAVASSVFSDMENEIREEQAVHPQPAIQTVSEQAQSAEQSAPKAKATEVDFEGNVISHSAAGTDLESSSGATNLTADELTDFFNAQQAENTPRTTEIEGRAPKIGGRAEKKGPYVIPSDLLTAYKDDQYWIIDDATKQAAMNLKQTLSEFNIEAEITGIKKGPVVTMFEILPAPGVKLSKIVALQDNIALSLAAQSVRIVAPIPGKQAVGIEVPNRHRSVVGFREIIEMDLPEWQKMAVPVVLGKDILGKAQLIDLVKTPHMLIAGATGSGKSVCVNSLILSILYKRSFRDVKLILVDPKVVELKLYNNIPHLLTPVITEPKKALQALQYCLCEMERRYALLDGMGVRDISNYNAKIKEQNICTEKLPYIVVIIDEFADLMATSGKELENIVARLTAMSRAVGIHLVLATQRPSVNVITGLIKANIPTRIAFMVASRTDSNIIIDTVGAEKLLGRGDMLYASAVDPAPTRIQGTFISDQEVEDVVNAVKEYGEPDYIDDEIFVDDEEDEARDLFGEPMDDDDPLYDQALEIVVQSGKASASYIQRRLKIGYNRAARLVEEMEERGIVGPQNGSKPREIIHIPS